MTPRNAFRAMARGCAVALLLLALAEGALRLGGYGPKFSPLLHAFTASRLYLPAVDAAGRRVWRTNPLYAHAFQHAEFTAEKGDAVRIFAVGGSVAYGWRLPDPPRQNFLARIADGLARRHHGLAIEAVDAGGLGWGSGRDAVLVDEILRHSPDLLIVISGHNEFWEYPLRRDLAPGRPTALKLARWAEQSRLCLALMDLVTHARRRLAPYEVTLTGRYEPVPDATYARVRAEYEANLRAMIRKAKTAGVAVALGTLPVNLEGEPAARADWLADASRHAPGLSADRVAAWNLAWEDGNRRADAGDWTGALGAYRRAATIDPGYAREWREIGRCLEHLGRWSEAREALWRHIDLSRRLVVREFNEIVRRVGREEKVPVADAAALFERAAPHGIPGYGLFLDSMHPNVRGHELLAKAFLELADAGRLPVSARPALR